MKISQKNKLNIGLGQWVRAKIVPHKASKEGDCLVMTELLSKANKKYKQYSLAVSIGEIGYFEINYLMEYQLNELSADIHEDSLQWIDNFIELGREESGDYVNWVIKLAPLA